MVTEYTILLKIIYFNDKTNVHKKNGYRNCNIKYVFIYTVTNRINKILAKSFVQYSHDVPS